FLNNQCLFTLVPLQIAIDGRDSDVEFGVLPYPKFDDAQEDYLSLEWSGFLCVPVSIQNPEMVGSVIEMLAYYSKNTTMIAYYEKLLGARIADAAQDAEMLNIIFSNIVIEPGLSLIGNNTT